jgi:hypothetical protein
MSDDLAPPSAGLFVPTATQIRAYLTHEGSLAARGPRGSLGRIRSAGSVIARFSKSHVGTDVIGRRIRQTNGPSCTNDGFLLRHSGALVKAFSVLVYVVTERG